MPLYEYQCDACGNRFEVIRKFSDPPLETCVKCGETGQVRKLISSPAFQFKGSGWYATDYAKKSGSGDSGSGSAGKSSEEKADKADAKTDAKPAEASKESTTSTADKPAAASTAATTTSKDK